MAARAESVSILRTLYRELRPTVNAPERHVYETQVWKYIIGLCRNCRTQPASKISEVQKNLEQTGRSYVYYLQGTREYNRISDEYKGAGERTADETAKLLGFKMPHEPKDVPKTTKDKDSTPSSGRIEKSSQSQSMSSESVVRSSTSGTSSPSPNLNTASSSLL